MNFYKTSLMIMIVALIVCLAVVGVAIMNSKNDLQFPPTKSDCPDYYVKNTVTGECEDVNNLFNHDDIECKTVNFDDETKFPNKNNTGTGANSAICEKKRWAETQCGLNWDGITNNENICYSKIKST